MKKKKGLLIIVAIIIIIVFFGYGVFVLTQNIKKDKEMTKQNIASIIKFYDEFNDLTVLFNEKNQNLILQMNNTFFSNLKEENNKFQATLDELTQILNNMENNSQELKNLCKATYYDATINQNCSSYQISLDTAKSVFDHSIQSYNNFITQYNDWIKENEGYEEMPLYNPNRN